MKNFLLSISIALAFVNLNFAQVGPITEICLVTVDTSSTFNTIVWQRADQISAVGIDSINIYRRTLGGGDSLIATVEYDSLSEYHDMDANPNLRAYMYRIAGINNNGDIGPLSSPARTIHFILVEDASNQLQLLWTPYMGNPINSYQCWDLVAGANPDLINSTPTSTDTSWYFNGATASTNYEMLVDVDWVSGCTSTKANHNTTRSNKTTIAFSGTGGSSSAITENSISEVYLAPNPSKDLTKLVFSSTSWNPITIKVFDMFGKEVLNLGQIKVLGQYSMDLDISNLSQGIYQVVIDNGSRHSYRLMKN